MSSPKIAFREIEDAFDVVSSGQPGENTAFLCLETGTIYFDSEFGDLEETLPDDIDDMDKYIVVPHKKELGLGKPLVLNFAQEVIPDDFDKVRSIFSRQGAYARFKDLLEYRDVLDQWYEYEAAAADHAIRAWCKEQQLEVEG